MITNHVLPPVLGFDSIIIPRSGIWSGHRLPPRLSRSALDTHTDQVPLPSVRPEDEVLGEAHERSRAKLEQRPQHEAHGHFVLHFYPTKSRHISESVVLAEMSKDGKATVQWGVYQKVMQEMEQRTRRKIGTDRSLRELIDFFLWYTLFSGKGKWEAEERKGGEGGAKREGEGEEGAERG